MGLGSTARKLQELADAAEKLFRQLSDLRERVNGLEEDLQETSDRVIDIETEQREQRALLEAVAEGQGVDVDAVVESVDGTPAEDADADDGASAPDDGGQEPGSDQSATSEGADEPTDAAADP